MGHIFISYSRADSAFADRLTSALQGARMEVWVDRDNIEGGQMWRAAISRAIAECDVFLVVLSPNSIGSKNVVKEMSIAETHDRPTMPILFESCQIPPEMDYQLAGLQWVQFADRPFDEAVARLLKSLRDEPTPPSAKSAATPSSSLNVPAQNPVPRPSPQPSPSPSPVASPPPQYAPQPSLAQILCGRWDIQITAPYVGPIARMTLDMYPNGAFYGQHMSPMGVMNVDGGWQIMPSGQLMLQGRQMVGWAATPYLAMVTFNRVTPGNLVGVTASGEQGFWTKIA